MKFEWKPLLAAPPLALAVAIALGGAALAADKMAPPNDTDAKMMEFDELRDARYCELFFITGTPDTGLTANFVNSSALNNAADPKDFCPASVWDKITPDALKAEYEVAGVFKNGPRHWVNDWVKLPAGGVGTFAGLEARWFGKVDLPKGFGTQGATAYNPTTVARKSSMGFDAGQPVFILDDPDGTPWVMQAFTTLVDKDLSYDSLKDLGNTLQLADGWSFRVKVLDEPLTIQAVDGVAQIVQDELQGTYDACFETACSYKP